MSLDESTQKQLRALPSVEELVSHPAAGPLLERHPRARVVEAVRAAVEAARRRILAGVAEASGSCEAPAGTHGASVKPEARTETARPSVGSREALLREAAVLLDAWLQPGLRRVANLTGIIIHTNLGRAPLAPEAVERVAEVARGYSNLEYDLAAGSRGRRETHVEALLTRLTGAESAFAVNNNAGAVLLVLMALAGGREVVVSRGQLVEIGGSFRLPDIMRAGGVRLVEVGTTNRTRIEDYEAAVTGETAMLLRVHTSNYRIVGFAEEASLAELVALGHRHGLLVVDDLGSGALEDLPVFHGEPSVAASLKVGADVVCFSGDKLLGGPQAGILVGKREVLERLRKHPAARALRLDKMTLAALEATLELYADPETAQVNVPVLRYLARTPEKTASLATSLREAIEARLGCALNGAHAGAAGLILEVEESSARAGGGSMPLVELPSHAVRIRFPESSTPTVLALDAELRRAPLPVVARVAQDSLHLDVIALEGNDVDAVAGSIACAIERVISGACAAQTPAQTSSGA